MNFTKDISVFRSLLERYVTAVKPDCPDSGKSNVVLYIQDVTQSIDFYIINWIPDYDEFFALADPLYIDNVLELEHVSISFLKDSHLFYKVYRRKDQVNWKKKFYELLPLKYGIPSSDNSR